MGVERHVTHREEKTGAHGVFVGEPWERDSLEETSVNGRIIFKIKHTVSRRGLD
jgi:hypothetical protein